MICSAGLGRNQCSFSYRYDRYDRYDPITTKVTLQIPPKYKLRGSGKTEFAL
jgi:hypothetical protein